MSVAQAEDLLRQLVRRGFDDATTGFLLVLDRDDLADVPERLDLGALRLHVARCGTELELRRALHRVGEAPLVAVVPDGLARRLPADLLGRARGRRVFALEIGEVLGAQLGVRVVEVHDEGLARLVYEHLERMRAELSHRTLPTVVDVPLLEELLLDATLGRGLRREAPDRLLARWVLGRDAPPPGPLGALLVRALERQGDDGRALGWGVTHERLSDLVVFGAVLSVRDEAVPEVAWGPLRPLVEHLGCGEREARRVVVGLARGALRRLTRQRPAPAGLRDLLEQADREARRALPAGSLATSDLLPLGLRARLDAIAGEVRRQAPVAPERLRALREHLAAELLSREVELVERLARLGRYVASPERAAGETAALVRDYLDDGAWADRAAAQLLRAMGSTTEGHDAARAVLAAWRARRDRGNERFAGHLARGYQRHLHAGVTPLHQVLKEHVRPAVEAGGGVFLVVLDGLSVPVALDLIHELAEDSTAPIGLGRAGWLPCVAPLPTVTSHARGALFQGEVPGDAFVEESRWRAEREAATDPARFRKAQALGGATRALFLKGDLADGGRALLEALGDPKLAVVAAVFNAVDDQIGSKNTQGRVTVRAAEISGLRPALEGALRAGRRVLLAADHGHTPFVGPELRVGEGPTPRHVELAAGEAAPPGFLEVDLERLGPRGRWAFAWRMGAYRGGPQAGFHGGASLEEVVIPLAWLEAEGALPDEPAWWFGDGPAAHAPGPHDLEAEPATPPRALPRPSAARAGPGAGRTAPPPAPVQTALFGGDRVAELAGRAGETGLPEATLAALDPDERAALVLLRQAQALSASDLAQALDKPIGRVNGFVLKLVRKLRGAGVACVRVGRLPSGEAQYHWDGAGGGR